MRHPTCLLLIAALSAPAMGQTRPSAPQDNQPQRATATSVTLLAGSDYARGQIAGQDYSTASVRGGAAISRGRFSLSAAIPYVVTTAPEDLIVSQGGLFGTPIFATPTSQTTRVRREGIGDLSLQAAYQLPVEGIEAVIGGEAKIPTASRQKGLGSGAFDYGVSGELAKRFGSIMPFISAVYTCVGQPQGFTVHDTLSGSAGARFNLSQASALSLSYAYEQSAIDAIGDRQSVALDLGTQLSPRLRLGLDGSAGLSADAPDMRLGLRLGVRIRPDRVTALRPKVGALASRRLRSMADCRSPAAFRHGRGAGCRQGFRGGRSGAQRRSARLCAGQARRG